MTKSFFAVPESSHLSRCPGGAASLPLTPRESEVLVLVSIGLANKEIAGRLSMSLSTVKVHVSHIYLKLGAKNRTTAVARGRAIGWLM